jgi:multicomponent K+:H+ antiporter subunit G
MTPDAIPLWIGVPAALLLIIGGLLTLIGSIGLLRLPNFYCRMHPPTMGVTLGTGSVLIASMLVSTAALHRPVIHEVVIAVLVVMTAPVTAILLMQAARRRSR